MEKVILVDELDREIGEMEKLEAHEKALLHRAISVFLFNSEGKLMLQQRAQGKYHSSGLWTNTCCSHPRPGEPTAEAAARRLREEMGLDTPLSPAFSFIYKVDFENGLTENELDHVWIGTEDRNPELNPDEAQAWRWISREQLANEIKADPSRFTHWFRLIWERAFEAAVPA